MWNLCNIRSVNPKDLTEKQFIELNEVTQDMWAHWIWELVQCKCCNKMMSKQDIFWHLEKEIYENTVANIMKILEIKEIPCIECWSETKFIYWEEHVENIKERLLNSQQSFLAICEDENWEIVWYEDWYIDNMENIFNRELAYHYSEIWLPEIRQRVSNILWKPTDKMLVFSSLGFKHKYINFFNLYELLKIFSRSIPDELIKEPWILEVDNKNIMSRICRSVWDIPLWINDNLNLKSKIKNTWKEYESILTILPNAAEWFRNFTNNSPRDFVKLINKKQIN